MSLSARTILNYRNALTEPLQLAFEIDFSNPLFSRLSRAQFLARPTVKKRMPDWDVNPVLERLKQTDFKNQSCDLENLLSKALFLTALATGNRSSELNAVQRAAITFRSTREVLLPVKPNFLFKNQSMKRTPPTIKIKSFPGIDPELCPVLTLKTYIERTREIVKGDSLFLHPITGRNLQRPSMSLKITSLISQACPNSIPLMHDVRKQAASLAWARGVEPGEIVESVFWSSSNVFIKHYLFCASLPATNCVVLNRQL